MSNHPRSSRRWTGAAFAPTVVLLVPRLLLLLPPAVAEHVDCPCIEQNITATSDDGKRVEIFFDSYAANGTELQCGKSISKEFSIDYGIGVCRAWDDGRWPFCQRSDDDVACTRQWCYVNATQCRSTNLTFYKSDYFPCDYYFSYETCGRELGSLDDEGTAQEDFAVDSKLEGYELVVGLPALDYPSHSRLNKTGTIIGYDDDILAGTGEYLGIFIEFLETIAKSAGFTVKYTYDSGGALTKTSSRWTACAYDVQGGLTDMCVGNFWETAARRAITPFASPIFSENFYLLVATPKVDHSFSTLVAKIFQPFSTNLWVAIMGAVMWTGIAYSLVDGKAHRAILAYVGPYHGLSPSKVLSLFKTPVFKLVITRTYKAFFEMLGGSPVEVEKRTNAQKLIVLSWGFFIVVTLAAYTANLAAFLTVNDATYKYESIDACIDADCKLCVYTSVSNVLSSQLATLYPAATFTPVSSRMRLVDMVADGRCDAALFGDYSFYEHPAYWKNCKVTFIGGLVASIPVGWPTRGDFATTISYWIIAAIEDGTWTSILDSYKPDYTCSSVDENLNDVSQMGPEEFAGPMFILMAGSVLSVILHYWKCKKEHVHRASKFVRARSSKFVRARR